MNTPSSLYLNFVFFSAKDPISWVVSANKVLAAKSARDLPITGISVEISLDILCTVASGSLLPSSKLRKYKYRYIKWGSSLKVSMFSRVGGRSSLLQVIDLTSFFLLQLLISSLYHQLLAHWQEQFDQPGPN